MAKKLKEVMGMAQLSSTARLAYLWICWTAKNGCSYASSADLCERIGVTDETITNVARELERANLVRRERAGAKGAGNKRWLILPALAAAIAASGAPSDAHLSLAPQTSEHRSIIKSQSKLGLGGLPPSAAMKS